MTQVFICPEETVINSRMRLLPFVKSIVTVQDDLQSSLAPTLAEIGVELSFQRNRSFERQPNTLVATTPHSFKGYESEVIVIPCVDNYVAPEGKILENSLYVAMTRARSLLAIYGVSRGSEASRKIGETIGT